MSATMKTVECKACHNTVEMKTFRMSKAKYCFSLKGYVCEDCLRHKKEHGTFEGRVRSDENESKKVKIEPEKEQRPQARFVSEPEETKEQRRENDENKGNSETKSAKKKKSGKMTLVKKWFTKKDDEESEGQDEQGEQEDNSDNQENQ